MRANIIISLTIILLYYLKINIIRYYINIFNFKKVRDILASLAL